MSRADVPAVERIITNTPQPAKPPSSLLLASISRGTESSQTHRWWEPDSNLWSHFEIGTAHVGANDREFVWRGLFPEWD
jgi:hypothetical protein